MQVSIILTFQMRTISFHTEYWDKYLLGEGPSSLSSLVLHSIQNKEKKSYFKIVPGFHLIHIYLYFSLKCLL